MPKESENHSEAFNNLMSDAPAAAYDLAPGLTAEEMQAIFFNTDALVEAPETVYRLSGGQYRYYYTFDPAGEPQFFVSVTSMIKQTMPTSPHLIKWIADMGYEESQNFAQDRADYGTFMHTEIAELLIARRYDMNGLKSKLKAYIDKEKLPQDFINYADEFKKDMLAFAQFMIDCKVKPLAIEIVLTHPQDGYAGAVDLVCEMTIEESGYFGEVLKSGINKGEPKKTKREVTITGMVDFKSGRKGFYEEHEVQLEGYKQMWDCHFPEKPIDKIFNWSPKAWRTAPSYNLKDQTDARSREKLQHLVSLAKIETDRKNNQVTIIEGVIDLDLGHLAGNITEMHLGELIKKRKAEKDSKK